MSDGTIVPPKYRLVLLNDEDRVVGAVTDLDLSPQSLLVVMPPTPDHVFHEKYIKELSDAFSDLGIKVMILSFQASFVRIEQVNE